MTQLPHSGLWFRKMSFCPSVMRSAYSFDIVISSPDFEVWYLSRSSMLTRLAKIPLKSNLQTLAKLLVETLIIGFRLIFFRKHFQAFFDKVCCTVSRKTLSGTLSESSTPLTEFSHSGMSLSWSTENRCLLNAQWMHRPTIGKCFRCCHDLDVPL